MEKQTVNLRWMALSRGMSVGLLGGEELVLWRLRRLSMEGDAWTVILCWKSAKCNMHIWITVMTISEQLQSERLHTNMFQLFTTGTKNWQGHTPLYIFGHTMMIWVLIFTEITHKSMKYSGVQMLKHFKGCLIWMCLSLEKKPKLISKS